MDRAFRVITGETVHKILSENVNDVFDIIKKAYLSYEQGDGVNPPSYFLKFPKKPKSRIIALPAHLDGEFNVSGIKWISSNPDNINKKIPRASAVVILNDAETGYPIACLEGSIISAVRTATSAVLAAEVIMGSKKADRIAFIGNGLIARYIYRAFKDSGWQIGNIALHDKDLKHSQRLMQFFSDEHANRTTVNETLHEAVSSSELIVFATVASEPYFSDTGVLKNNPLLLNISLRDLSPNILLASNNVVDDVEHVLNANTSPHLTEMQTGNSNFINGTLAGLISGAFQIDKEKPTVFSPMGLGILDIALGSYIFSKALSQNDLTTVENFFYELDR